MSDIPGPVIGVLSAVLPDLYSHSGLNELFLLAGAPGDAPPGNKQIKIQEWLHRTNQQVPEPLAILGRLIEPIMAADTNDPNWGEQRRERRAKVESTLTRCGLAYGLGGVVMSVLAAEGLAPVARESTEAHLPVHIEGRAIGERHGDGEVERPRAARVVISLHGFRTRGKWQKDLTRSLNDCGFRHEPWDYGYLGAPRLLLPGSRRALVDWFRDEYDRYVSTGAPIPSIIAHSFGTYIATEALRRYPHIKIDALILCGSIIRPDYPWLEILESGRVRRVFNDYGREDVWAALVGWLVEDAGPSGVDGFVCDHPRMLQRRNPDWRHSDYFHEGNYRAAWLPFLDGHEPQSAGPSMKRRVGPRLVFLGVGAGIVIMLWPYVAPPTNWLLRSRSGDLTLLNPIVRGLPAGRCRAEVAGSAFQLFQKGWLVARHEKNVFYAIVKKPLENRVDWYRQNSNGFVKGAVVPCSDIPDESRLRLGFRWWYCNAMPGSLRAELGPPLTAESRAWVQFQAWTGGLLIYGIESTQPGIENEEFQSLAGVFLESEASQERGVGRVAHVEATTTTANAYCTSLWYPAQLDGSLHRLPKSRCANPASPDRYRRGALACSVFGF